jgi:hypothetical protein
MFPFIFVVLSILLNRYNLTAFYKKSPISLPGEFFKIEQRYKIYNVYGSLSTFPFIRCSDPFIFKP